MPLKDGFAVPGWHSTHAPSAAEKYSPAGQPHWDAPGGLIVPTGHASHGATPGSDLKMPTKSAAHEHAAAPGALVEPGGHAAHSGPAPVGE